MHKWATLLNSPRAWDKIIVRTNAIRKLGESGVNRRFARLIAALAAVIALAIAMPTIRENLAVKKRERRETVN